MTMDSPSKQLNLRNRDDLCYLEGVVNVSTGWYSETQRTLMLQLIDIAKAHTNCPSNDADSTPVTTALPVAPVRISEMPTASSDASD